MLRRLRLAEISAPFKQMVGRLRDQTAYVSPVKKKSLPAITVYRQFDPAEDNGVDGYYFSERAGRDSVAFLLVERSGIEAVYGVLTQWHGPLRRFSTGAYTGSLDKQGLSVEQIVQEEAMEEAGYHVGVDRLEFIATEPVSGQTNEQVHLFLVDVTGVQQQPPQPENIFEASVEMTWLTAAQVLAQGEWKAKLIALAANVAGSSALGELEGTS